MVARAQSAYTAANAAGVVVVTLTVHNTLAPVVTPPFTEGATVTETLAATAGFDYINDPNTLHNVLLVDDKAEIV
ncbi:MAG: hypothetical protein HC914_21255 [Chloroflexaceae bacterium]|nr:hypothetical protein [Chloroflexaceae bacterium]